ncbi:MAG: DUF4184 family protein [Chloroflexi bacterium]|nr:DUF4184 family protein [Chloroflexota bacterium]
MPLTISHPAATIPLARRGLVLSALIIGSLTPDYPYFIPFLHRSGFSHSIYGLFLFCLPWGLISLALFQLLLKYPVLSLFPVEHQRRLYSVSKDFSFFPVKRFLLIAFSILVGAFTHILWDSFTHPKTLLVQEFVFLRRIVFTIASYPVQIYKILQHGSTLVGGLLLIYWYIQWYKNAPESSLPKRMTIPVSTKLILFIIMSFVALISGILTGFTDIPSAEPSIYYPLFLGHTFIVGLSVFILELILFSVYWHFKNLFK